jgi:hypothetical protein
VVLVVIAAVVAGITLSAQPTQSEAPAPAPTLPANEGVLGTHLDELLESVTP